MDFYGEEKLEPSPKKMKQKVWRKLPLALIERILAELPVEYIIGMRAVCREWRNLTTCPVFRDMWRTAERPQKSMLVVRYRYSSRKLSRCFSTGMARWYNIPNSCFLPKDAFLLKDARLGLTAARLHDRIAVGNPMTDEWVYFNPPPNSNWDGSPWSLLVLLRTGGDVHDKKFEPDFRILIDEYFYDSRTKQWQHVDLPGNTAYGSIYCDGIAWFYYLCHDDNQVKLVRGRLEDPSSVEVLGAWATSKMAYPVYHHLIDYRGEVGLVCDHFGMMKSLSVFVFDVVSQEWKEKCRLPNELMKLIFKEQFKKKVPAHKSREWQFASGGSRFTVIIPRGCSGFILFDCWDETWRWVEDPVQVEPFSRRSDLFCLELSL